MSREKIGEFLGIDLIVDDDLADDTVVIHNAKEAYMLKDGRLAKVNIQEDWARESRIAGRKI